MLCYHELILRLISGQLLEKTDWHRFWWLNAPLDDGDPFLDIEEPLVVMTKGRSRGGGPFSPIGFQSSIRRLLSTWKVEDLTDIEERIPSASALVNNTKRQ